MKYEFVVSSAVIRLYVKWGGSQALGVDLFINKAFLLAQLVWLKTAKAIF